MTMFQPEELGMSSPILDKLIMKNEEEIKRLSEKDYKKSWYMKNRERILVERKKYYSKNSENIKTTVKTYRNNNLDSIKDKKKSYAIKNKDKIAIKRSEYHKTHRERLNNIAKTYRKSHKTEINKYFKNRRLIDSSFRISGNLRSRIKKFYKSKTFDGGNISFTSVGCTPEFLRNYLETKFKTGMSHENYGYKGWHIDHIIPLASAKNKEELERLCHYTNLQPLWWWENLQKSDNI